ncbi:translation initiation factor IF-5A [Halovenus rubra]|uniref:Translation initiation factor IF-5A n=2 Tax=Halovenus rubra TaxID=869890 RepID=A0ACC7DY10_9EURY|nr:translation initiation factor IF-5A [Halovenus rubra]
MAKQQTEVRELDEGSYVMIEEVPCEITGYSTAKPGKHGSAKARIEATGVYDGQKRSLSQPVDAKIWVPIINRKQGQVLDVRDGEIQVMDLETYDNFVMRVENDEVDLAPDDEIEFLEHEDQRKII